MSAYVPGTEEKDLKRYAMSLQQLAAGRSNGVGTITCSTGTTTTVSDANISSSSVISLSPKTANAAAAIANIYVSAVASGSFTITHGSTTSTDRSFGYAIQG